MPNPARKGTEQGAEVRPLAWERHEEGVNMRLENTEEELSPFLGETLEMQHGRFQTREFVTRTHKSPENHGSRVIIF